MPTSAYTPTAEQQTALDLFATGQSLAIEAGAGAGKTSTLRLLAESTTRRGQYIAFNKAIVIEAGEKMPPNVKCSTAHSLAFRAVGKDYAHRLKSGRMRSMDIAARLKLDPIKLTTQDGQSKLLGAGFLAGLAMRAVTRFCQSADEQPEEHHVPYIDGIDIPPGAMQNNRLVRRALIGAVRTAWEDLSDPNGSLPFKHDHYLKLFQLSGPRIAADFILFDEAQDANPVLVAIVAAQKHAQLVWVGDSQQAIYAFTGAINALATVPADTRAFLTQSFRFGPDIAAVANDVLEALDAELTLSGTEGIPSTVGEIDRPNVILTRTNAAAVQTVMTAKADGLQPHLVGGGGEVVSFAKAARLLMGTGRTDHPELACFDSWNEVRDYVAQDEQGGELRLMVKLIEEFGVETILDALDRMPREENANLIVSTAHKSKGREWDAVKLAGDFPDQPADEELRLLYVAVTRARRQLDITSVGYFAEREAVGADLPAALADPTLPPPVAPAAPQEPAGGRTIADSAHYRVTVDFGDDRLRVYRVLARDQAEAEQHVASLASGLLKVAVSEDGADRDERVFDADATYEIPQAVAR